MQAVVQLAPNEPGAWYEFGVLLLSAGDLQNAELSLRQAVTLQPSYANAWFVLARIYYEVADNGRALEALEHVRALNPDNQAVLEAIQQVQSGASATSLDTGVESSADDVAAPENE
jgi:cytochrome c-type biogenesis protein CcmH/NrfG